MFWAEDWAWGALWSVMMIFFHIGALFVMSTLIFHDKVVKLRARSLPASILVFSLLATGAVLLHAVEAGGWAALYWRLGAADEYSDALLHSLGAYSTMGDSTVTFEKKWRLILQIESITAAVSMGLSTAFLFSALNRLQQVIDNARATTRNSRERD